MLGCDEAEAGSEPAVNPDKPDKPDDSHDGDSAQKRDVALIHGRTADGEGLRILRQREQRLELGEIRPLKEGRPIQGEVVASLSKPRPDFPLLCDVSVALPAREAPGDAPRRARKSGPAQVATDSYRENWDVVFKGPRSALN